MEGSNNFGIIVFSSNFFLACRDLKSKLEGENGKDGPVSETEEEDDDDDLEAVTIREVTDEIIDQERRDEGNATLRELKQMYDSVIELEQALSDHDLAAAVQGLTRLPCIAHKIHIVSICIY